LSESTITVAMVGSAEVAVIVPAALFTRATIVSPGWMDGAGGSTTIGGWVGVGAGEGLALASGEADSPGAGEASGDASGEVPVSGAGVSAGKTGAGMAGFTAPVGAATGGLTWALTDTANTATSKPIAATAANARRNTDLTCSARPAGAN
jgi:hypothetical protein